jgi:hypothetical protein
MTSVKGSNTSEQRLLKAVQKAVGAKEDGLIGTQTMVDIAVKVGADCWPLTVKMFSMPVIVCKDIIINNPKQPCKNFNNSLSGSFSYQKAPCSILINNGDTICGAACHAFNNKPESVIYRLKNGSFGIKRCTYSTELPKDVKWAVGGMGLLDMYNAAAEGFTGAYSDVLRKTDHTVLGVKNGMCYLIMCRAMNGSQVNDYCKNKMKLDMAIMLDGGHVAAINGEEGFSKVNTSQVQYYMIQAIK